MKKNKILDRVLAIYLVLSSSLSLLFLAVFILGNKLTIVFLMPMFVSLALLIAIIIYNCKVLFYYSLSKKRALINSCAAFLQIPFIYTDGFQFKYNQGIQLVIYGKMLKGDTNFKFGLDFEKFSYLINIQSRNFEYTSMGIDLLALCLFIFYLHQYKTINKNLD